MDVASLNHAQAVTLALFAVMAYDYLLNLDLEIDLIWGNKVTAMTLVYVMLRFLGILWAVAELLVSSGMSFTGQRCFLLYAIIVTSEVLILVFLQVMMIVRVYVLLGQPRNVLMFLSVCFVIAHSLNFAAMFSLLAAGNGLASEEKLSGMSVCVYELPSHRRWSYPLGCGIMLGFEILLCGFALQHASKHLKECRWSSPTCTAGTLMTVMIRDNLIYFIVALIDLLIAAVTEAPSLQSANPLTDVLFAVEFGFNTMVGPWMMLDLRKQNNRDDEATFEE